MPVLSAKRLERLNQKNYPAHHHATAYKVLAVLALIALALQSSLLLLALFEQPLAYTITDPGPEPIQSPTFLRILSANTGGGFYQRNRVDVLTDGDNFYSSELEAIRSAKQFVHIECYIFKQGRLTDRILHALEERARAGIEVRMVIDALGSATFPDRRFKTLREAGGRVAWYHPIRWYTWPRLNNRTHRELVIVDGAVAFTGGAGFADQWLYDSKRDPRWRDTMVRIEGEAASGLNASFTENWLESMGEILVSPEFFPFRGGPGSSNALVVTSSPTSGRSTEARILFQCLIAKAARSIHITSPYFLPDKSLRAELVKAARDRKVDVTIIGPNQKTDHLMTRRSSRATYGELLLAGARVFEYEPSMVHAKVMTIDGVWAVVGSTNLDSRSFGLNDEVNVAFPEAEVVKRLEQDFENDLQRSRQISYRDWKNRPIWERIEEWFSWLLINQE